MGNREDKIKLSHLTFVNELLGDDFWQEMEVELTTNILEAAGLDVVSRSQSRLIHEYIYLVSKDGKLAKKLRLGGELLPRIYFRLQNIILPMTQSKLEALWIMRSYPDLVDVVKAMLCAPIMGREKFTPASFNVLTRTMKTLYARILALLLRQERQVMEIGGEKIPIIREHDLDRSFVGSFGRGEKKHLDVLMSNIGFEKGLSSTGVGFYYFSPEHLMVMEQANMATSRDGWKFLLDETALFHLTLANVAVNRFNVERSLVNLISTVFAGAVYVSVAAFRSGVNIPNIFFEDDIVYKILPPLVEMAAHSIGGIEWSNKIWRGKKMDRYHLNFFSILNPCFIRINRGQFVVQENTMIRKISNELSYVGGR